MTFKEKLLKENPEIKISKVIGHECPCDHRFERCSDSFDACLKYENINVPEEKTCTKCWNREIPGTEPTADDNSIYQSILYTAINEFGADAQIKMMFEEMSELQHALCKNLRGKNNEDNIAEEIADVQIMLDQMKILFECEQKTNKYYGEKIKRLADNIGYKTQDER